MTGRDDAVAAALQVTRTMLAAIHRVLEIEAPGPVTDGMYDHLEALDEALRALDAAREPSGA